MNNSCVRVPDVPSTPRTLIDPLAIISFAVTDKDPKAVVAPTFPVNLTVPPEVPPVVIVKVL